MPCSGSAGVIRGLPRYGNGEVRSSAATRPVLGLEPEFVNDVVGLAVPVVVEAVHAERVDIVTVLSRGR
jgi:hypothetical protein